MVCFSFLNKYHSYKITLMSRNHYDLKWSMEWRKHAKRPKIKKLHWWSENILLFADFAFVFGFWDKVANNTMFWSISIKQDFSTNLSCQCLKLAWNIKETYTNDFDAWYKFFLFFSAQYVGLYVSNWPIQGIFIQQHYVYMNIEQCTNNTY